MATEGKLCRTNLFYKGMTGLVDVGRVMDVVYLYFTKAFDTVFHKIFIDKLTKYGIDK